MQGSRFATVAEVEAALADAAPLERPEWPARQRSSLEFARGWCFARQGRTEEALAAAQRQVAINREGGVEIAAMFAMSNVSAAELMLGRSEAALDHAREAIARLETLGATSGAGHLYRNAAMALALMNRMDEVLPLARVAHTLLTTEGDEYLVLPTLALVAASQGRLEDAARVAGFHAAAQARLVRVPEPLAGSVRTRLDPLLAQLAGADLERLSAEGAALRADDAFRIGFGDAS